MFTECRNVGMSMSDYDLLRIIFYNYCLLRYRAVVIIDLKLGLSNI